ncbi:MAG: hypothetical protein ACLFS7_00575 [Desulfosudaceae bacterium]
MKRMVWLLVGCLLVGSGSVGAAQISPSPLMGPEFEAGVHKGRGELVYINYEDVHGAGVQGAKRYVLSNRLALSPSLGAFYLSGDQTYRDDVAGQVDMDMDYFFFSGGLRGEVQHRVGIVNFIAFGGALGHYGESDSETVTSFGRDETESTDTGLGWEAGLQAAIQTGPVMTTLFYRRDSLRVTTENDDASGNATVSDSEQTFTFDNDTFGVDVLFHNGISLSALYSVLDDEGRNDGITIIKAGFTF